MNMYVLLWSVSSMCMNPNILHWVSQKKFFLLFSFWFHLVWILYSRRKKWQTTFLLWWVIFFIIHTNVTRMKEGCWHDFLMDFIFSVEGAGHRLHQCPGGSSLSQERLLHSHPQDSGPVGCWRCCKRRDRGFDCGAVHQHRGAALSGGRRRRNQSYFKKKCNYSLSLSLGYMFIFLTLLFIFYFAFQVHYDLGGIFFQRGCTDQPSFMKAKEHFRQTVELLKKVRFTLIDA